MKREAHYCDRYAEQHERGDCECQCFACTAAQSQKRHDDAIESETVAAIVAWLRTYRDCGLAQSYADAIERGDWRKGGV